MKPLDEPLLEAVFDRLAKDEVPAGTADLVLGAYAGDDELRLALTGGHPDLPEIAADQQRPPESVYLEAVTAEGFRGIGPSASLRLRPSPGLTLVVGRNGSGKSSLAEAAEVALTGTSPRWSGQAVFRDGWRNLHQGSPCQIQLILRADDRPGPIRVSRTWQQTDAEPEQARVTVTGAGERLPSVTRLGWDAALENFRPFLTAGDFGRIISAKPSTLFDALAPILGMDALAAADKRLMAARKDITDRLKVRKAERGRLRGILAEMDDDRGTAAAALLFRQNPDLTALDDLLSSAGQTGADPVAAACSRLADSVLPAPSAVESLTERLESASQDVSAAAAADNRAGQRLARLLQDALDYHASHGDGPCPVCQTGTLDPHWRERAQQSLSSFQDQTRQAEEAAQRQAGALAAARELWTVGGGPVLADASTAASVLGAPAQHLARALQTWQTTGQDLVV